MFLAKIFILTFKRNKIPLKPKISKEFSQLTNAKSTVLFLKKVLWNLMNNYLVSLQKSGESGDQEMAD